MHSYPLHSPVDAQCDCCKILRDFTFKSRSDHVICKSCVRHTGDSPSKTSLRNQDHVKLFRSELQLCLEDRESDRQIHESKLAEVKAIIGQRDRILAELRTAVADLKATIRTGDFNPAVERWMSDEAVEAAETNRDRAYRSRDTAYEGLWRVGRIHHPDETADHLCSCDRKADRCHELEAIMHTLSAVTVWEKAQIERLHDDLEHGLPHDHPEVNRYGPGRRRRRNIG